MFAKEFIHDVQYDWYGKRIATCSSDGKAKIWAQKSDGTWNVQSVIQPNLGALYRVSWAYPEFCQVIALCGADQCCTIWEEVEAPDQLGRVFSRWAKRAELGDARQSVNDIKFAPRHLGFRLATGSADSVVRIYEVNDAMNLTHWVFSDEFKGDDGQGITSISWCASPFDLPTLVIGGESGVVRIWSQSSRTRKWNPVLELHAHKGRINDVSWAPNIGRSLHMISSAGSDGTLCCWTVVPENPVDANSAMLQYRQTIENDDGTREGNEIVSRSRVVLIQPSSKSEFSATPKNLDFNSSAGDVSGDKEDVIESKIVTPAESGFRGTLSAAFQDNAGPVWVCSWNSLGTVVGSTSDDGKLRLRRAGLGVGRWHTIVEMDAPSFTGEALDLSSMQSVCNGSAQ